MKPDISPDEKSAETTQPEQPARHGSLAEALKTSTRIVDNTAKALKEGRILVLAGAPGAPRPIAPVVKVRKGSPDTADKPDAKPPKSPD